eukprot:COSAG03_NODE_2221_length_2990_cov_1.948807_3_plen_103_part_00
MSTRSAAATSSTSKRKRPSASATHAESPAKRRTTRGAGGAASAAAAPVADPPTLVPVAPPATCDWCTALQSGRDAGKFIDITLIVDDCKIPAHKNVLAGLSP